MNPSPKFASPAAESPAAPPPPAKLRPLFRPIDWLALVICFAVVGVIYFLTLAPEVTLEDSGELTTGSYWAGIPHPPGYPFWAIYSWLWTQLVPFGNVAWRVELGEAAAAAMGCSLIAFMVSRGSSMLMESIASLREIKGKKENAICLVCGVTAGLLMALDNSMWKESVAINRISVFGVPWLIIVLLSMLRWIYAPRQRGYLYCAMFFFGICATIHQPLVVAALGIEIGIACTQPKLGRDLFFGNSLLWGLGILARNAHVWSSFEQVTPMVLYIFNTIGICSLITFLGLAIPLRFFSPWTRKDTMLSRCGAGVLAGLLLAFWFVARQHGGPSFWIVFLWTAGLVLLIWGLRLMSEWPACVFMALLWLLGASFYFYEAIAGMTDPPMQWGYPRTVVGFFHALTRGQYERINPTNIIDNPGMFLEQLKALAQGVADAFNWVYMFFAALPFLFFFKMQRRERNWLVTVAAIYPFLGVLLTIFLNPQKDRQSADLLKVFFAASHTVVAILIGYGLALTAACLAAQYQKFRLWGWLGGAVALVLACICLLHGTGTHYFGLAGGGEVTPFSLPHWIARAFAPGQYGLPIFANLLLVALPLIFLAALAFSRQRAPLLLTLGLFAAMPVYSGLAHWFQSEQRGHWFGYWYGHDMFSPPFKGPDGKYTYDAKLREQAAIGPDAKYIYPEISRDAVLYGGTDPGRFCPTYMIFCESFIPHRCQPEQDETFDRRDVYLITQNALADPTYLNYLRAQYNRSLQKDPPFFQEFLPTELPQAFTGPTKSLAWLDDIFETLGAKIEFRRRTESSFFHPGDFLNPAGLNSRLRPHDGQDELSKFIAAQLGADAGQLVPGNKDQDDLRRTLSAGFNRLITGSNLYSPERFANIQLPPLLRQAAATNQIPATTLRINRRLLEEAYPGEIARSLGGVYPDTEIHIASEQELEKCKNDYVADAARRYMHDRQHPEEPPQIKPGEDVRPGPDGNLSFGGVLVVMGINSFVTKAIFDANPGHEFYVEESYPMDWMYPYLTPYGIIMKVNREPLPEISEDIVARDHRFWSDYSERLIGNWITYDTTTQEICDFAEKIYLRHDYSDFKGDRKFVRDEDAQKDFSKLRTAIGGSIYEWRALRDPNPAERARMQKEADFAFKQAFAFCPYSEAVYRYAQFLLDEHRVEDAALVAQTCLKLDPFNGQVQNMVHQLTHPRGEAPAAGAAPGGSVTSDALFAEIAGDLKSNQTGRAVQLLETILHHPQATPPLLLKVGEVYAEMGNLPKCEEAFRRAAQLSPGSSVILYNLAVLLAVENRPADSASNLVQAFAANDAERAVGAKVPNFRENARTNPIFSHIRQTPEFRAVLPEK